MADIQISKPEMLKILQELMKEKTVIAPVSNGKKVDYLEAKESGEILMNDELPYKSPKEYFFPRCEKIITFKGDEVSEEKSDRQTVLFGVKPCDLDALAIMRKVFTTGKFADPFFEAHYENTLLIGTSCADKKQGCFCDKRETDMLFSENADLFLVDAGDSYNVAFVSEKGANALKSYIPGIEKSVAPEKASTENAGTLTIKAEENEVFEKFEWEDATATCQGCGMCTYICPTCHCFMFKDVMENDEASRFRLWDSCMFPKFTLHASGHNPREEKHERYRQRVMHKYLYVKENFDAVACTGCGRCIRSCPAGMNIKTIVERIMEVFS